MRKNVPVVLQMENVECGAASLAMILRYYGKASVSLEQLRIDCGVSRDGVTAKGIKKAAAKNGLVCKAFKASPESVKKLNMPVIIHWNMGHFAVLWGYGKKCFYINDPAIGRYKVSAEEFDKRFTGVALAFEKTEDFKADKDKKYMGFTAKCVKPLLPLILFASFVTAVITCFNMLMPFFNSVYIDDILLARNLGMFPLLGAAMAVIVILAFVSSVLKAKMECYIEKRINVSLSVGFMEKMLKLPIVFFNQRTPGELANRQLGSFETARLIVGFLTPVFFQLVLIAVYCAAAFLFNVYIALIGAVAVSINILAAVLVSQKMSSLSALVRKNEGLYQSSVAAAADMIETIKSCSCGDAMFARLTGTAALNAEAKAKTEKINIYSSGMFYFINLIVSAAVLITGAYEVLNGEFSVGAAVGVMGMVTAFLTPIGSFINSIKAVYSLKSIAERTDDTMKYADENIFLPETERQTKASDGGIRAENVSFKYAGCDNYALKDLSFNLEKGKSIAFVGGSGSGKSTAAKLIAGLYRESEGHIYYGEARKSELKKEYFYSKIATVSQDVKLYEGTLFDNISMWDNSVAYDDVVIACKAACLHNDIIMRKDAYYEKITEGGKNLSGGQRQRIEIARAILRKPQILILDEATSALDAQTEKEVMENIRSMGITLVIIAHRLSTIRDCGEILVFDGGEVSERGNHNFLMEQKGLYFRLVSDKGV